MSKLFYTTALLLLSSLSMSMEPVDTNSASRYSNNAIELLQSFAPGSELSELDCEVFAPIIDFIRMGHQITDPEEYIKFNQKLPILFIFGFGLTKSMTSYSGDWLRLAFDIEVGTKTILTATESIFEKWKADNACERESGICTQALINARIGWEESDDEENEESDA